MIALAATVMSVGPASANVANTTVWNGGADKCLDAMNDADHSAGADGDPIQLFECNGNPQQNWNFKENVGAWGEITNGYKGLCLDATSDATHDTGVAGDTVQLWTCNGSPQQERAPVLIETQSGAMWYKLENQYGGGTLVLDAQNNATHSPSFNGDPVQLWNYDGSSAVNQLWHY